MDIRNKKAKLNIAIMENDIKTALNISKELGLSMRFICRMAEVNVGNLWSFINGRIPFYDEEHTKKLYKVIREVLLDV